MEGDQDELGEEEEEVVEVVEVDDESVKAKKYRVLVTCPELPQQAYDILQEKSYVYFLPKDYDGRTLLRFAQGMEGILLAGPDLSIDKEFLKSAGLGLRVVSVVGWNVDRIDVDEALKKKIKIGVCPPELALDSAAEVAVGLALLLCRRMKEGHNCLLRNTAKYNTPDWLLGSDLKDSVCGIVGLGKLGSCIAVRLAPFAPSKIIYYSRRIARVAKHIGIERLVLDELLDTSDVVFLCLPCNRTTRGMFNQEIFMKMKKSSVLVNCSNGGLVNINDLYCALRKGTIAGAAMDSEITDIPRKKHPIHGMDNFIVVPSLSSCSAIVKVRMSVMAASNLISGLVQREMLNPYLREEDTDDMVETEEKRHARESGIQEEIERLAEEARRAEELASEAPPENDEEETEAEVTEEESGGEAGEEVIDEIREEQEEAQEMMEEQPIEESTEEAP